MSRKYTGRIPHSDTYIIDDECSEKGFRERISLCRSYAEDVIREIEKSRRTTMGLINLIYDITMDASGEEGKKKAMWFRITHNCATMTNLTRDRDRLMELLPEIDKNLPDFEARGKRHELWSTRGEIEAITDRYDVEYKDPADRDAGEGF